MRQVKLKFYTFINTADTIMNVNGHIGNPCRANANVSAHSLYLCQSTEGMCGGQHSGVIEFWGAGMDSVETEFP